MPRPRRTRDVDRRRTEQPAGRQVLRAAAAPRLPRRRAEFEGRPGRSVIEEVLAKLCAPFDGSLLASVYAVEHDRLWLVAQHGYAEVRDGFELEHGVMGRAIRTRTIQLVADVSGRRRLLAATGSVTAEVAIPFQAGDRHRRAFSPWSRSAVACPARQVRRSCHSPRCSESVSPRVGRAFDSNVEDLVRLCVHAARCAASARSQSSATRTTARILGLSSAQLDLWREDDIQPRLVSFWRRHDVHLEPLDAELLVRLERTADAHVTVERRGGAAGRPQRRIDRPR